MKTKTAIATILATTLIAGLGEIAAAPDVYAKDTQWGGKHAVHKDTQWGG